MLTKLLLFFFLFSAVAYAEQVYVIEMSTYDGALSYDNLYVGDGSIIGIENGREFTIETRDFGDRPLFRTTFDSPAIGMFTLMTPYQKNVQRIIIIDRLGEEVLSVPTAQYADTCKNRICEGHESYESCPADCPSGGKDDYCDMKEDSICDPDCGGKDPDCAVAPKIAPVVELQTSPQISNQNAIQNDADDDSSFPLFGSAIIVVILLAVLVVLAFLRKDSQEIHRYVLNCLKEGYSAEQIRTALEGHDERQIEEAFAWARERLN